MAIVPNRGGPFRAIGARIKTARATKQGQKATAASKSNMMQQAHNAGAWKTGENLDWSATKKQKQYEQHSQEFMNW